MTSSTTALTMHKLPVDLIQYQLASFLNTISAVKLTQTSHFFFNILRHRIRLNEDFATTIDRFMQQSSAHSKHIGLCSFVRTKTKTELNQLIQHMNNHQVVKLCPLFSLKIDFNKHLKNIILPDNLHTVQFGSWFDKSLYQVTLPQNLHTLTFGQKFDQSMDEVTLPPNLHTLTFGFHFNKSLKQLTLPPKLHTLKFGNCFNQSLDRVTLPPNLYTLIFGWNFNKSLDRVTLPPNLHTLTFGFHFNKSLDRVTLPPKLHTLTFGYYFNQSLEQVTLPPNLHTLTFGYCFKQSLDKVTIPLQCRTKTYIFYSCLMLNWFTQSTELDVLLVDSDLLTVLCINFWHSAQKSSHTLLSLR